MRLIDTKTLQVKEFQANQRPKYAILSHRWLDEEITYQQFQNSKLYGRTKSYQKIVSFCRETIRDGFEWAWVDTCCIDKTNATELAEAINSMFAWYRDAALCYVYLDDVSTKHVNINSSSEIRRILERSVWFTRGWTLQELIAPKIVQFFDHTWEYFGTKQDFAEVISDITNIDAALMRNERDLDDFSCAQKMSWAAFRKTTRLEDRAYSLLGLFGITLPSVYGEGSKAFLRLQEAIMMRSPDQSLFAWTLEEPEELAPWVERLRDWKLAMTSGYEPQGILAPSPDCFYSSSSIVPFQKPLENSEIGLPRPFLKGVQRTQPAILRPSSELPYLITNMGLQISFLVRKIDKIGGRLVYQVALNCYDELDPSPHVCTICLIKDVKGVQAQRAEPYFLETLSVPKKWWKDTLFLVQPIWKAPRETIPALSQTARTQVGHLKSQAFSRVEALYDARDDAKDDAKDDQIRKRKSRQKRMAIGGALIAGIALAGHVRSKSAEPGGRYSRSRSRSRSRG